MKTALKAAGFLIIVAALIWWEFFRPPRVDDFFDDWFHAAPKEFGIDMDAIVGMVEAEAGWSDVIETVGFGEPMQYIYQGNQVKGWYDVATDLLVTFHDGVVVDVRKCDGDCFRPRD